MAWLNATPKPPEGSRRAKADNPAKRISRIDKMKKEGIAPAMPPNPAPHIIERLIEIGITQSSGMGPMPLSWGEIEAWQRQMHVPLPPWEVRLLRSLSLAYISEGSKAEDESCPPPWRGKVTQAEMNSELAQLREALG